MFIFIIYTTVRCFHIFLLSTNNINIDYDNNIFWSENMAQNIYKQTS